jgi:hypothetical protein
MTNVKFKFDENAVRRLAQEATRNVANAAQPVLDRVAQSHSGKPLDEVLTALRRAPWPAGVRLPDETLRMCATEISEGRRVEVRVGRVKP